MMTCMSAYSTITRGRVCHLFLYAIYAAVLGDIILLTAIWPSVIMSLIGVTYAV